MKLKTKLSQQYEKKHKKTLEGMFTSGRSGYCEDI